MAVKINIFGGLGDGAVAKVIMGSFDNSSGTDTGSIIGVKVVEKGKNYLYPPFVEIIDDSNQGYGAVARSVINENGEVTDIYIVSEGENYPINNSNPNFLEEIATTNPSDIPNYVSSVYIQQSGFGYKSTDIVSDDSGNTYSITVDDDGSILSVTINTPTDNNIPNSVNKSVTTLSPRIVINNYVIVRDLPIITIISKTGIGAILNPILDKLPIEVIQGNESSIKESKFIKDCII